MGELPVVDAPFVKFNKWKKIFKFTTNSGLYSHWQVDQSSYNCAVYQTGVKLETCPVSTANNSPSTVSHSRLAWTTPFVRCIGMGSCLRSGHVSGGGSCGAGANLQKRKRKSDWMGITIKFNIVAYLCLTSSASLPGTRYRYPPPPPMPRYDSGEGTTWHLPPMDRRLPPFDIVHRSTMSCL